MTKFYAYSEHCDNLCHDPKDALMAFFEDGGEWHGEPMTLCVFEPNLIPDKWIRAEAHSLAAETAEHWDDSFAMAAASATRTEEEIEALAAKLMPIIREFALARLAHDCHKTGEMVVSAAEVAEIAEQFKP